MSDYTMKAPTMLDRKTATASYMLVSYSHRDGEIVDSMLLNWYKKGANYWYDTEMYSGDNWKSKVETYLDCQKGCRGMIIFVSADYLNSESCAYELGQFLSIHAQNADFKAFVILVMPNDYQTGDPISALFEKARDELIRRMQLDKGDPLYAPGSQTLHGNQEKLETILHDREIIYSTICNNTIESECEKLFTDVFTLHGCSVKVNEVLSKYARQGKLQYDYDEKGSQHYKIVFGEICEERRYRNGDYMPVNSVKAVWTAYNLQNGFFYLLPNSRQVSVRIGACGRILARGKLVLLENPNAYLLSKAKDGSTRRRLVFTEGEKQQLNRIRFLYNDERESADLEDEINWALSGEFEAEADGYFFVMERGDIATAPFYYADRFSVDVYENIWRDEIASVIPVLEIKAPPLD